MNINDVLDEIEASFEDILIDDEEKEYFNGYKALKGATDDEITAFENDFNIKLPEDFKKYYTIKNGSAYPFRLLYITYTYNNKNTCIPFTVMSLDAMKNIKQYFCERDDLMENYYDKNEIEKLDERIKPYIYHKKWFPFAQLVGGDVYLMLDFDPREKGNRGQIIQYVHDPDFIYYVTETFTELLQDTVHNLRKRRRGIK